MNSIDKINQIEHWRTLINIKNRKWEDFVQVIHKAENAAALFEFDPDLLTCSQEKLDHFKQTGYFTYGSGK